MLAESHRVKVWRFAVDRHYTYQAIDQSARTRDVRVRACFDHKPECATCRPFVIDDELSCLRPPSARPTPLWRGQST